MEPIFFFFFFFKSFVALDSTELIRVMLESEYISWGSGKIASKLHSCLLFWYQVTYYLYLVTSLFSLKIICYLKSKNLCFSL